MNVLLTLVALAVQQSAPEAKVPMEPFTLNVTVDVAPGRSVRDCRTDSRGAVAPHWLINACANLGRREFLAGLGIPAETEGRLNVVLMMEVDGRSLPPGPVGDLVFRSEAIFRVSGGGRIEECSVGETVGTGRNIDLCRVGFPDRIDPFVAPGATRAGRLSLSTYRN